MKRLVIPVLASCVIALTGLLWHQQRPEAVSLGPTESKPATGPTSGSSTASTDNLVPARTKSKIRTVHHKPTIEDTTKLLRSTILPTVEIPGDQTLIERVADINKLIRTAGVKPGQLTLILGSSESFSQLRCSDELKLSQVSILDVLESHCGATRVRYRVRENGIVEFADMLESRDVDPATFTPEKSGPSTQP